MAVASCYGVFYPLQSVGVIKSAVWTALAETLNCYLCFDFVFFVFSTVLYVVRRF